MGVQVPSAAPNHDNSNPKPVGNGFGFIVYFKEFDIFKSDFEECFRIALKHGMCDISIHPPFIYKMNETEKSLSMENLCRFLDKWLFKTTEHGISLSLESHVSGNYFLFNGLDQFVKFTDTYSEIGILIDFAHNYYDGYSEEEIIKTFISRNIKGFHVSDAKQGIAFTEEELKEKTHLPIGSGDINFIKLLGALDTSSNLYGVLEIKSNCKGIVSSLESLTKINCEGY